MVGASTALAVLPFQGVPWLCRTNGPKVTPVAMVPGRADARHILAPDASALAVLDMNCKRAGLFRILPDEPYFEPFLPFASLPQNCKGHALAVVGDSLLVGGSCKTGEALWIHTHGRDEGWRVVAIPEHLRSQGKAIDGLLIDGSRVIAVDDILVPKWLVIYQVEGPGELREAEVVQLPEHITYERIYVAVLGSRGVGLVSKGNCHGSSGTFISLLDSTDFTEWAVWSARSPTGLFDGGTKDDMAPLDRALLESVDLGFVGETILVACGDRGLLAVDLEEWILPPHLPRQIVEEWDPQSGSRVFHENLSVPVKAGGPGPELAFKEVPGLVAVARIVIPTLPDRAGAFPIGPGPDGIQTFVWLPGP